MKIPTLLKLWMAIQAVAYRAAEASSGNVFVIDQLPGTSRVTGLTQVPYYAGGVEVGNTSVAVFSQAQENNDRGETYLVAGSSTPFALNNPATSQASILAKLQGNQGEQAGTRVSVLPPATLAIACTPPINKVYLVPTHTISFGQTTALNNYPTIHGTTDLQLADINHLGDLNGDGQPEWFAAGYPSTSEADYTLAGYIIVGQPTLGQNNLDLATATQARPIYVPKTGSNVIWRAHALGHFANHTHAVMFTPHSDTPVEPSWLNSAYILFDTDNLAPSYHFPVPATQGLRLELDITQPYNGWQVIPWQSTPAQQSIFIGIENHALTTAARSYRLDRNQSDWISFNGTVRLSTITSPHGTELDTATAPAWSIRSVDTINASGNPRCDDLLIGWLYRHPTNGFKVGATSVVFCGDEDFPAHTDLLNPAAGITFNNFATFGDARYGNIAYNTGDMLDTGRNTFGLWIDGLVATDEGFNTNGVLYFHSGETIYRSHSPSPSPLPASITPTPSPSPSLPCAQPIPMHVLRQVIPIEEIAKQTLCMQTITGKTTQHSTWKSPVVFFTADEPKTNQVSEHCHAATPKSAGSRTA